MNVLNKLIVFPKNDFTTINKQKIDYDFFIKCQKINL